jgi:ESX secretion-associated protein EspA/E
MNPFDILSGISTIQSVIDHVRNAADGDPRGFLGFGADGVGITQSVISLESLAAEAAETPVIEAGLWAIIAFNWMCGFGDPEKGDRFGEGGSQFNEIIEKLESAAPDSSWTGSGSNAYAGQNVKQQDRAKTMVDADFDMNQIISCEANQLSGTRDILDHAGTVLGYAILPALAALRIPGIGPEISLGIQLGAVGGTVPVCQVEMINMALNAVRNAQSIEKATALYNSANPDPTTRTREVGLSWTHQPVTAEDTATGTPDDPPPVGSEAPPSAPSVPPSHPPRAPSVPTPSAPPTAPPLPTPSAPSAPSDPGVGPNIGSAPPPSIPLAPQGPLMPAAQRGGSRALPSTAPPSSVPGSASAPASLPGQSARQASPLPTVTRLKDIAVQEVQATPGITNGERAPVSRGAQSDRDAQAPSAAPTTRTGDTE